VECDARQRFKLSVQAAFKFIIVYLPLNITTHASLFSDFHNADFDYPQSN
jgi:hypothetical protein